jgi:hypothetical protein
MLFQRALAKMYNSNTTFKGGKGAHPGKGLATYLYVCVGPRRVVRGGLLRK